MDAHMTSQVSYSGGRIFPKGVTHISQMSGKEHCALLMVHLGVMAHAPVKYAWELTLATKHLLNYLYLAQLPSHTDQTIRALEDAYAQFDTAKEIWIKNRSRQGEKGLVIPHFEIPKLHITRHIAQQLHWKGTTDNYLTEVIEHMHIDTLKDVYQATNRKEWKRQTVCYLVRYEKLVDFSLYQKWANGEKGQALDDTLGADEAEGIELVTNKGMRDLIPFMIQHCLTYSMAIDADEPLSQTAVPSQRGGFAKSVAKSTTKTLLPDGLLQLRPSAECPKKRRRKEESEEKEERHTKRVQQS